ncbi:DUF7510 family protein [Haloarcula salina]|uniref:DUF7510 family protein n=1 Tax=Haloarcula salina TaxID=1429914 RepID=UPI003C701876
MSGAPDNEPDSESRPVDFDMTIDDGRTRIEVTGDRDTAVVVESASGEKIYLPPEDFDREPEDRQSPYDSPYQPASQTADSPYQTHPDATAVTGMEPTADGYLVVHPEPVTDVRFLR